MYHHVYRTEEIFLQDLLIILMHKQYKSPVSKVLTLYGRVINMKPFIHSCIHDLSTAIRNEETPLSRFSSGSETFASALLERHFLQYHMDSDVISRFK